VRAPSRGAGTRGTARARFPGLAGGFFRRCVTKPDPAALQGFSLGVGAFVGLAGTAKRSTRGVLLVGIQLEGRGIGSVPLGKPIRADPMREVGKVGAPSRGKSSHQLEVVDDQDRRPHA
jgi:hypothetical protein